MIIAAVEDSPVICLIRWGEETVQMLSCFSLWSAIHASSLFTDKEDCLWVIGSRKTEGGAESGNAIAITTFQIHSRL